MLTADYSRATLICSTSAHGSMSPNWLRSLQVPRAIPSLSGNPGITRPSRAFRLADHLIPAFTRATQWKSRAVKRTIPAANPNSEQLPGLVPPDPWRWSTVVRPRYPGHLISSIAKPCPVYPAAGPPQEDESTKLKIGVTPACCPLPHPRSILHSSGSPTGAREPGGVVASHAAAFTKPWKHSEVSKRFGSKNGLSGNRQQNMVPKGPRVGLFPD